MENIHNTSYTDSQADSATEIWFQELDLPTFLQLKNMFMHAKYSDHDVTIGQTICLLMDIKAHMMDDEAFTALATFKRLEDKYELDIPVITGLP